MLEKEIFNIKSDRHFVETALEVFRYQYNHSPVYGEYVRLLGVDPPSVKRLEDIPFLPVSLFKSRRVFSDEFAKQEMIFTSSSTSGMTPSKHYVADLSIYRSSFLKGFSHFYGDPAQYVFLGLLPSYLEREGSSLIYMVEGLIKSSESQDGGFFLYDHQELENRLKRLKTEGKRAVLFGVSFALLDFAQNRSIDYEDLIVIETGGMKGRGVELTKEQIYMQLESCFNTHKIHSEYGMAELLSQAYALEREIYSTPPWMRVLIRDLNIPFKYLGEGAQGGINIIDLANLYSCSFIETQDMGRIKLPSNFSVEGRISFSELRGCNMLIE